MTTVNTIKRDGHGILPIRGKRKSRPARRRALRAENNRRSKFLKNALGFIERGIAIFPVVENSKIPLTPNGFKDASTDPRQIKKWANEFPYANIGIPTGQGNGFVVIDLDRKSGVDGVKEFEKFCDSLGIDLPETYRVNTPSGGQHIYFKTRYARLIRNSAGVLGPGIDVRGEGGYVVTEGSVIDGKRYRCVSGSIDNVAMLPKALRRAIKNARRRRRGGNSRSTYVKGQRNDTLYDEAYRLHASGRSFEKTLDLIHRLNQSSCRPPLDDREVEQLVESATSYEIPPTIVPSDVAFADLFVAQHSKDVRFCEEGWEVWDDTRWKNDSLGEIQERGKDTARSIFDLAKNAESLDDQSKLGKWGVSALNKARIVSGIDLASSNRKVRLTMANFDRDPKLFNVANGTFDLQSQKLRPHNRSDLITRISPVEYDEAAKCPRWDSFLDTIFDGSRAVIRFVQSAVGYSLTGLTNEHCLFICYGHGDNGKTVLLETIAQLAADYARSSSIETFMARGSRGGIPNDIARLAGVRLVTVGETPLYGAFNESLVKDLTGGDTITARFLHREFFDFRPQFKLWIRANHKPRIRGTDHGIWRRIRLIPFDVTIPKKDRDPYLLDKLRGELPGILAWAVRGCLAWQKHGLRSPTEVRHATKSYRSEQDVLGAYLDDRTKKKGTSYIMARPLYENYADWCDTNRERAVPEKDFSGAMIERGYKKERKKSGWRYVGINFRK